jgi:S1-C subfamily serine protease
VNALDLVLVIAALASALSGFRHGFLVAACSLVGFLGGAWVGLRVAPAVLGSAPRVFSTAVFALLLVVVVAYVGQLVGGFVGRRLRSLVVWRPGRLVDAAAGAITGVAYVLVFAWALGVAVATSGLPSITAPVRGSAVLGAIDNALPDGSDGLFQGFTRLLDRNGFPTVFAPFSHEAIAPVDPPAADESITLAVRNAAASVVRVQGIACGEGVTGSGFVYAAGVVVTNAHVVAGVTEPRVVTRDGQRLVAQVVEFAPEVDIAVLLVRGLTATPLSFGGTAGPDDPAAVIGYPGGGRQTIEPARVRTERVIVGPDIYDKERVVRDVYALRSTVLPGDSGGPLVAPNGTVLGVVFAASLEDRDTGYALTAEEAGPAIAAGVARRSPVGTGPCI